jgi:hypothetical protein
LIHLAADGGGVSPQASGDDLDLEPIGLVSTIQNEGDLDPPTDSLVDTQPQITAPAIGAELGLKPDCVDVKTELDSLLIALNSATPHPPLAAVESSSMAGILTTISTTEPVTHTQALIQELNITRNQLAIASTELQVLHQRNHVQIDRADAHLFQAKQLKFRTQQLAQYSQSQVEKVQEMLGEIDRVRIEIVTSLDKFGGYPEIQRMLTQLETTRHALVIAHEQVTIGQETFYESLQVIQQQVAAISYDSEQKLGQYHESIQQLSQTVSIDRLRIAGMSVDLSTKINNLYDLNAEITTMHAQIVDKSQTLQSRMSELDRGFGELSQSMRVEQAQFYELTAGSIDKADMIQSQLAGIVNQLSVDRQLLITLTTELESVRQNARQSADRLDDFNLREHELISRYNDFQVRQKDWAVTTKKILTWLWLLSGAVGIIFLLSIRILVS